MEIWIVSAVLLATLVLTLHQLSPETPVLTLISSLAALLTLIVLFVRHAPSALSRFVSHIREGLPRMSGELALFLAAGVLAAGIGSAAGKDNTTSRKP